MRLKITLLSLATLLITIIIIVTSKNSSNILLSNASPQEKTYYLLWKNEADLHHDDFVKEVKSIAENKGINKIYTQTISFNPTTLFYFRDGQIERRVRSDQSTAELNAFFNKEIYEPSKSKYGVIHKEGFSYAIIDVVISHLITNEDVEEVDEKQYIVSIKYYVYNNENKIKLKSNEAFAGVLKNNIKIVDNAGRVVEPKDNYSNMTTANLYIGDRAKGILSFLLPVNNIDGLQLIIGDNKQMLLFDEMKKVKTLNDGEFDF